MVELRKTVENSIKGTKSTATNLNNIPLTKQAEKALKITFLEAKLFKSEIIGTEHLLLSILKDDDNVATQILNKLGVSYDIVKEEIEGQNPDIKAESTQNPSDEIGRASCRERV